MIVKNFGCAVFGVDATIITVETNIIKGLKFFMVGLPDNAVKESHQPVSYTHLRAHETVLDLVCRLLLEKKKNQTQTNQFN